MLPLPKMVGWYCRICQFKTYPLWECGGGGGGQDGLSQMTLTSKELQLIKKISSPALFFTKIHKLLFYYISQYYANIAKQKYCNFPLSESFKASPVCFSH